MKAPRRVIGFVLLAIVAAAAGALWWAGWYLTKPVRQAVGSPPPELNASVVVFPSESGSPIHGWLSPPRGRTGAVLLLPPVRANRRAMVTRAKFLADAGYATLLIDLQATGESPGNAITFGWRERLDVLAAVRFLNERMPGAPVGIIGSSLGGAAALLATPPLDVQGLVLEAVYPSIDRAVRNRLRMRIGNAGDLLAPLLLWQLQPRLGVSRDQLRPVDHVARVRCPVLVIGGTEDLHTTEADTRLLFEAAPGPKQLFLIPGAAHVDFYHAHGDRYRLTVLDFLKTAFAVPARRDAI